MIHNYLYIMSFPSKYPKPVNARVSVSTFAPRSVLSHRIYVCHRFKKVVRLHSNDTLYHSCLRLCTVVLRAHIFDFLAAYAYGTVGRKMDSYNDITIIILKMSVKCIPYTYIRVYNIK